LKEGIDRYVWPMTLADRHLSDHIDRVCHALSLDDERSTFRPVLWTDPSTKPERLSQIWFAGVHANVGGGYPDDGLAYVTLQWIMDEAAQFGLRFDAALQAEYAARADPHGEQYDSRSGLAGYYRYGPRDMDSLCNDADHGVTIQRLQVHESVLERIRRWQVAYAPICISKQPRGYDLYGRSEKSPVLVPLPAVESTGDIKRRAEDMHLVNDAVFRRCVAYLFTVAFTVVLAVLPLFDWVASHVWAPVSARLDAAAPVLFRLLIAPFSGLAWIGNVLSHIPGWNWVTQQFGNTLNWMVDEQFFPAWAAIWLKSFANHPALFLFCGLTLLWLFFRKSQLLQDQVFARAEYAWRRISGVTMESTTGKQKEQITRPAPTWTDPIVRWLRTDSVISAVYVWISRRVVPLLFALFIAAPIGLLILPFFIPKFIRNRNRRGNYQVRLLNDRLERIPGVYPRKG